MTPIKIYECPGCGAKEESFFILHHDRRYSGSPAYVACPDKPVEIILFRKEDLLSDEFLKRAFFPFGPSSDPKLMNVAWDNMKHALEDNSGENATG